MAVFSQALPVADEATAEKAQDMLWPDMTCC